MLLYVNFIPPCKNCETDDYYIPCVNGKTDLIHVWVAMPCLPYLKCLPGCGVGVVGVLRFGCGWGRDNIVLTIASKQGISRFVLL